MLISFLRWFTFAVTASILLVYFKGGTSLARDAQESIRTTGSYFGAALILSMTLVWMVILAGQLLVCLGYLTLDAWAQNRWMVGLGAGLNALGTLAIYYFRFRYLGRFWAGGVKLHSSPDVVDEGPYGVVRHPLYAMALVTYPGMALAFASWWNWLACGLMVIGYIVITAYEDRFLANNLPGYSAYQQRTRHRLIPGVW
jgi:protein-S-isoprenylcysteine O-methyltransferase Ste14